MSLESPTEQSRQKQILRQQAQSNRRALPDKDRRSRWIIATLLDQPEYRDAGTVLFYVDVRNEVRTRPVLPNVLASGKNMVVPYCQDGELRLVSLTRLEELEIGAYGILEPHADLRNQPDRHVEMREIDLAIVPGVAFDCSGRRLGHGLGYYDRLLRHARARTPLVALAFECQLFPEIPTETHDVLMDKIITERAVYETSQSRRIDGPDHGLS